jgi:molecular chaperone DnaK
LNTASHKLADVLYKQAGTQPEAGAASGSSTSSEAKPAEGEVIDAEYVDVDDKRK